MSKSNELLLKRLEELKISHFDKHNECTSLEKQLQVNKVYEGNEWLISINFYIIYVLIEHQYYL